MKKILLLGLLAVLALIAYGCQTIQTVPKPIEPEPIQNQTITPSNPCSSEETFLPNFMEGYDCQPTDKIKVCEAVGGSWKLFSNGCGDSCSEKPRLCTQAITAACDCGPTKCLDVVPITNKTCSVTPQGEQLCTLEAIRKQFECIDDPYEPYGSAEEACEATNGNWTYYGGGCRPEPIRQMCGGIAGIKCPTTSIDSPEVGCRYFEISRNGSKTLLPPSSPAPYPDAMGECYALVCFSRGVKCVCPSLLTFGLQGCKEYPARTNELMSIAGGWQ